jgi:hypothetical protein
VEADIFFCGQVEVQAGLLEDDADVLPDGTG